MKYAIFALLLAAALPAQILEAPRLIAKCSPHYPPQARADKIEGTVVLYIEIGPDGRVHAVRVQKSLGRAVDGSAIEAVKQWKFKPGLKNFEPVMTKATIEVNFRLDDVGTECKAGPPQVEERKAE